MGSGGTRRGVAPEISRLYGRFWGCASRPDGAPAAVFRLLGHGKCSPSPLFCPAYAPGPQCRRCRRCRPAAACSRWPNKRNLCRDSDPFQGFAGICRDLKGFRVEFPSPHNLSPHRTTLILGVCLRVFVRALATRVLCGNTSIIHITCYRNGPGWTARPRPVSPSLLLRARWLVELPPLVRARGEGPVVDSLRALRLVLTPATALAPVWRG